MIKYHWQMVHQQKLVNVFHVRNSGCIRESVIPLECIIVGTFLLQGKLGIT